MNIFIEILNQWGGRFADFAWPMLWQSSLLIVILFAIEFSLRRRIRASIRYALWLVVLVKLCLPPTLALPTSPIWWLPKTQPAAVPPVHYTVTYGTQPLPEFSQNHAPVYVAPEPVMTSAAWELLASGSVSILLLVLLLARWRHIAKLVRSSTFSGRLTALLNETREHVGVKCSSPVRLAQNTTSPAICGLFRPAILIPPSLAEKFSDEQLRAVLLHEVVHLRRRDVWLNCLQALLQIVYWWHPLLWLANARVRHVREEAVDDAVMLALRGKSETYALTLLEVAKLALNRPLASLGLVGILESRNALRQRIERLVNFRAPRKAGLTFISLCGIFVFSIVAVPMGNAPAQMANQTSSSIGDDVSHTNVGISATALLSERTNVFAEKLKARQLVQDGKLFYEMGRFDEAERKLRSALALEPENQAAHYYMNLVQAAKAPQRKGIVQLHAGRRQILDELNRIRFDHFGPIRQPLPQVLRDLQHLTTGPGTNDSGINFAIADKPDNHLPMINPNTGLPADESRTNDGDIDSVLISIDQPLKNATLVDILDAIVSHADKPIEYSILDWGILFSPRNDFQSPRLFSRTFKVNTNVFLANLQRRAGSETNVAAALRRLLLTNGLDLTSPESVFYLNRMGVLFVHATEKDLTAVEKVVVQLNDNQIAPQIPPQIHIKARFLEVPKGTLNGFAKGIGVTNQSRQIVGILSPQNAIAVLRMLESRSGFEELAAPEVTTTSGRQTEMRATTTITIVTNFEYQKVLAGPAIVPQTNSVETGPVLNTIATVLPDGHTIDLKATTSLTEFVGYVKSPAQPVKHINDFGDHVPGHLPVVLPDFQVSKANAHLKIWDGQTVVLLGITATHSTTVRQMERVTDTNGGQTVASPVYREQVTRTKKQKELLVLITVTLVDPAGNRIHSDDEMPSAKDAIPVQDGS